MADSDRRRLHLAPDERDNWLDCVGLGWPNLSYTRQTPCLRIDKETARESEKELRGEPATAELLAWN